MVIEKFFLFCAFQNEIRNSFQVFISKNFISNLCLSKGVDLQSKLSHKLEHLVVGTALGTLLVHSVSLFEDLYMSN